MDLLLEAWRIVSNHDDVEESCRRIGELVHGELQFEDLLLFGIDFDHSRVELRASYSPGSPSPLPVPADSGFDSLVEWCGRRQLLFAPDSSHPLSGLLGSELSGRAIFSPLTDSTGLLGISVLLLSTPESEQRASRRLSALGEPLAVALRNDLRLGEMRRLRDAVEAENEALLKRLGRQDITDAVIGAESGLREVMERVAQVGPTDVPVLLLGETGTGKEVIARMIHAASSHSEGPMLRVNCGAIPAGVIDSELFGHERGSFTGAEERHRGWFERADGGTLFLDEIGELPPDAQVRLLRVLQDGVIQRVGGSSVVHVDVRIVAATHRDLWTMVTEGGFREDLWYRLSVFPVHIPPLRVRKHDIPALASHFASRAGFRHGGGPLNLSAADMELLIDYHWPGNVRELNAVIERAAILGNGKSLHIAQALGGEYSSGARGGAATPGQPSAETESNSRELDSVVKQHIEETLRLTRGVIEGPYGAARLLDIKPNTLRSRMRKLGINWREFRSIF